MVCPLSTSDYVFGIFNHFFDNTTIDVPRHVQVFYKAVYKLPCSKCVYFIATLIYTFFMKFLSDATIYHI